MPTRTTLPTASTLPATSEKFGNVELFDVGARKHTAYHDALSHIYSRLDLERVDPSTYSTVERNLDEYREFLETLGSPQTLIKLVHVTGTRGKGSFVAFLEAILEAAGYKTGATISPHLTEVRERIRISGKDLDYDRFAKYYNELREQVDRYVGGVNYRTVFELLTALAFHTFAREQVDVGLVEVGLGGKLDATNVITPVLSAISRIGLDHTKVLGDTIRQIARDKSHIIKNGIPALSALQTDDAEDEILKRVDITGSQLWRIGNEAEFSLSNMSESGIEFDLSTPYRAYTGLTSPMLGEHMARNAALAVLAADRLAFDGHFKITPEAVRQGLQNVRWHGRGEIIQRDPLFILDGAHTAQGATALSAMLDATFPARKRVMILGFNKDKDVDGFLSSFSTPPEMVFATRAATPRAMEAVDVVAHCTRYGWRATVAPPEKVIEMAIQFSDSQTLIIGTGSLYIVGMLRGMFVNSEISASK